MRKAHNTTIWTDEMLEFLKNNFSTLTNRQLSEHLGLKITVTRHKLYQLGFKRMELEYWTPEMVDFLKANYYKMGDTEIAEVFNQKYPKKKGWSKKHIDKKRSQLGIKRNFLQIERIKSQNLDRYRLAQKKSLQNKAFAPEGDIRVWRKCKVIKLNGRFVPLAPVVYKQHFGSVPIGHVVTFKDGNHHNCSPDNLTTISRSQLAAQNANPEKSGRSIREFYRKQKLRYKLGLSSIYDAKEKRHV